MGVATQQEDSYLVLLDGDGAVVKQFARSQGKITLGRASKNDPGTLDPSQGKFRSDSTKVMSSRHAQISWEGDYAYITDLDSTNGVLVTRDEERVSLKPGVAYRIFEGDQVTFGKQVSERSTGEVICRPLVLTASLRSSAAIPLESTVAPSMAGSFPLLRGRTLSGERHHNEPAMYSSDEEDVGPTQAIEDKVADSLKSTSFFPTKRGFGLSDDDVLISPDEEDGSLERLQSVNLSDVEVINNDEDTARSLKPAPSVVESVAAASHVAASGSPAPDASDVEMIDASSRPVSRVDNRDARSPRPMERRIMQDENRDLMLAIQRSLHSERPPLPVSPETLKTPSSRLREDESNSTNDPAPVQQTAEDEWEKRRRERNERREAPWAQFWTAIEKPKRIKPESLSDKLDAPKLDDSVADGASVASHLPSPVISEAGESDQEQDPTRYSCPPDPEETAGVSVGVEEVDEFPAPPTLVTTDEANEEKKLDKTRELQSQLEWVESENEFLETRSPQLSPVALVDDRPLWQPEDQEEPVAEQTPFADYIEPSTDADEAGTPIPIPELWVEPSTFADHRDPPAYVEAVNKEADIEEPQPANIQHDRAENEFGLAREVLADLMAFQAASVGLQSESEEADDDDSSEESGEESAIEYDEMEEEEEEVDEEEEESDGMTEWSGLDEVDGEEEIDMDFDPELSGRVAMELDEAREKLDMEASREVDVDEGELDEMQGPLARDASPELVGTDFVRSGLQSRDAVAEAGAVSSSLNTLSVAAAVEAAGPILVTDEELSPLQSSPFVEDLGLVGASVGAVATEEELSDAEDSNQVEKVNADEIASPQVEDETSAASPRPSPSRKRTLDEADLFDNDEAVALLDQSCSTHAEALETLADHVQSLNSAVVTVPVAANAPPELPHAKRRRLNVPFKSFALGLVTGVIGTVAGLAALPTSDC